MWTPDMRQCNVIVTSLMCCSNSSTLLVSVFPPDVEPAAGICSHSDTRASVRSNTDAGDQVWLTVSIESQSHDVTSCPASAPLASVTRCSLSFSISFILSAFLQFTFSILRQISSAAAADIRNGNFHDFNKVKQRLLCEHRKNYRSHEIYRALVSSKHVKFTNAVF